MSSEIKIRWLTIYKFSERHRNEPISNDYFESHLKIKTVQCLLKVPERASNSSNAYLRLYMGLKPQ